jgi:RNA polymerase sigma factor (sigma-70 family)
MASQDFNRMSAPDPTPHTVQRNPVFSATNWSLVLVAGQSDGELAAQALAKLCQTYWYPLYAYVRRKGYDAHEAEDLTQGFFQQLMRLQSIKQVRGEGKFRSFLLSALEHFLAAEWNRARRLKRGGNVPPISLDEVQPEARYQLEPVDERTAEKIYERRWAMTVLEQALERLRQDCLAAHKEALFEQLKGMLGGDGATSTYADFAARLNMSEVAVKVAMHRLRQRYGELVREEVARTLTNPDELEDEIRYLLAALSP